MNVKEIEKKTKELALKVIEEVNIDGLFLVKSLY